LQKAKAAIIETTKKILCAIILLLLFGFIPIVAIVCQSDDEVSEAISSAMKARIAISIAAYHNNRGILD